MISECLEGINEPTQINKFYDQSSPYKYPPIMICPDEKRNQHNKDITLYNLDARELGPCGIPFNVRNLNDAGILQKGYSQFIDLDSELKRINHFDDKCYYDKFKNDPMDAKPCSGLAENKHILVKDYGPVGKKNPTCNDSFQCDGNPNDRDRFNWCDHVYLIDKCVNFEEFKKCPQPISGPSKIRDELLAKKNNLPNYYTFHPSNSCVQYPCQRLFNNFTKRSTLPNFHNTESINPQYLF